MALDTLHPSKGPAFQPKDSDLEALAALATTAFGRNFLELADQAAARLKLDVPSMAQHGTKFDKSGGTLTGGVVIDAPGHAALTLDKGGSTNISLIEALTAGSRRWQLDFGDGAAESGSNAGSDFYIRRHGDNGAQLNLPMGIRRSDGEMFFEKMPRIGVGFSTSPIIESGSNGNGYYVKYADGTMMINRVYQIGMAGGNADNYFSMTYAASFSNSPAVLINYEPVSTQGYTVSKCSAQVGSVGTGVFFKTDVAQTMQFALFALGRWK